MHVSISCYTCINIQNNDLHTSRVDKFYVIIVTQQSGTAMITSVYKTKTELHIFGLFRNVLPPNFVQAIEIFFLQSTGRKPKAEFNKLRKMGRYPSNPGFKKIK